MTIKYIRPKKSDITGIEKLLEETFDDTFVKNNIVSVFEIKDEIKEKINKINKDIIEHDRRFHFVIAKDDDEVVGICACFPVSELIREYIDGIREDELEIGCTYIMPKYQNAGIGKMLVSLIKEQIKFVGKSSYYLCSGFETAQRYWRNKLGEPIFTIKDIWGAGKHELIWRESI